MSEAAIRAQIKTILEGVSGIGIVHNRQRFAATWEKFLELFKTTDKKINGCCITRDSASAERLNWDQDERTHEYKIRGYYGLSDEAATEITATALVEAICDAFRADTGLGGTAGDSGPMQVLIVEPRAFGGVLCHFYELGLSVNEYVPFG